MKFTLNFEKKHFWVIVALLVVVGIGVVIAVNVDTARPWHALQQVAKSGTDMSSVDSNGDGVIDLSERATTLNPIQGCASGKVLKWDGTNWVCGDTGSSLPTNCASGQVLKWDGTNWVCQNDETGSGWPAGSYCIMKSGACPTGFTANSLGIIAGRFAHDACAIGERVAGDSRCDGTTLGYLTISACCK